MQINHPDKGFIVADDFSSSEAAASNFFYLMNAKIEKETIIGEIYERYCLYIRNLKIDSID